MRANNTVVLDDIPPTTPASYRAERAAARLPADHSSDQLGPDLAVGRAGRDAGKGIGEHAADRDRRVREAGR